MDSYNINVNSLINDIESGHDVTNWKHNGYSIWPVLRIYLYMNIIKMKEDRRSASVKKKRAFFLKTKKIIFSLKELVLIGFKKFTKIYVGAPSHCVKYNDLQYNRYFDPLMDADESTSLYFSKSESKNGVYKPERHFLISPIRMVFSMIDKILGIYSTPTNYIQELCDILGTRGVQLEGFEETLKRKIRTVDVSYAMFRFIFKKLKPEQVWVLCYYSADMLGMLIAAHKLSIPTIDMQHGGQGVNHLAYNNWTNVPDNGYEALPNSFYTWDESSANIINSWAKDNKKHSAKVFGNPWVNGWKQKIFQESDYDWPKNIVLYTLQPIGEPLEEYLLQTIKNTKDKWNWWLRLHPRQMNERDKIILRLKEYGVFDSINIEEATKLPLPEILIHTKVHITKFSGCAIEAYNFNIPSIIIDSRGVEIYRTYIESKGKMRADLRKDSIFLQANIEDYYC